MMDEKKENIINGKLGITRWWCDILYKYNFYIRELIKQQFKFMLPNSLCCTVYSMFKLIVNDIARVT